MRADPEEYVPHETRRSRLPIVELLLALALIAGLAVFWFWTKETKPVATVVQVPAVAVPAAAPEAPPVPDIPRRPATVTAAAPDVAGTDGALNEESAPTAAAPLTPQQGDELLRRQLAAAGARPILMKLLSAQQPLEVSAALIDGLGHGVILRKFLPAGLHSEAFSVNVEDDAIYMSPTSFLRYDKFTDAIAVLDTSVLVNTFHLLRPVYEQTYGYLGLDAGDFGHAVIRTLDLVLATPEIGEPIALRAKAVVYEFADPRLESLPPLQKQLLRMGPDNIRRIKLQAQNLRAGLLAQ
jgi:hypothetical protein